jgi:UPF0716 protein FxsA
VALLVALFIAVPLLELYVIIQVGQAIGGAPTLALLLAGAVLGSFLIRHQGLGAWRRFNEAFAQRRFPGREIADGVLIVIGGALLVTPGFITDVFGLLLLIPPTRAIARSLLRRYAGHRFILMGVGRAPGRPGAGPDGRREYDFDATAEEIDDDDPLLPR